MPPKEMMCNRKVLSEKKSVLIYRNTVYTFTVLSKLINGFATYYVSPFAAATKQHLVNLNVYTNSYRIWLNRSHSELYRVAGNAITERAQPAVVATTTTTTTTAASSASASTESKWFRLNTVVHTRSKCYVRHSFNTCNSSSSSSHSSHSSWRNLVILLKTFCFLMLFAGVTALPPVIRIGKYFCSLL